jgi:GH15 family glucan-1,4-alpha-glucosidase
MRAREHTLDLAVVGNCEISALIDDSASVVWCCLPRMDADPVFCTLLDPDVSESAPGHFSIEISDRAETAQSYLRNTAILETILTDARGNRLRIVDFCPRFRARDRIFRPMMLVRIIEPLVGRPVATVRLRPRFDHGATTPQVSRGSHNLAFRGGGSADFRLTTNASLTAIAQELPFVVDAPFAFVLGPDQTLEESPLALAQGFLEETRSYWQDWVRGLAIPFEWQDAVIRAAISLKLCTYEDTGAVLAALTTSVPESPGSGRNWDYRYCWLRDSYFVIQALNRLGATRTMEDYLRFIDAIVARCGDAELQPLFSVTGEADVPERTVTSLRGYRGMGPVRVGNHAYLQRQNDVYGAIVMASAHSFFDQRLMNLGDAVQFSQLESSASGPCRARSSGRRAVGVPRLRASAHVLGRDVLGRPADRLARIGRRLGLHDRAAYWRERAGAMRTHILEHAWNPAVGAFTSSYGGEDLDATALLLPELGLVDGRDPRFISTLAAIERHLKDGDWLYRYRHRDDFGRPETAFTICAFWYVNALDHAGRREEARELFERLLARRTRLGLLSEDIDP